MPLAVDARVVPSVMYATLAPPSAPISHDPRRPRSEPTGPQKRRPPIGIGGSGEKRTLRITAKYAQHWNFVGGSPEEFARKRDVLVSHCADIGPDPKEIMLSSHIRLSDNHL